MSDELVTVRRSDLWVAFKMATGHKPDPDGLTPFALERIAYALGDRDLAAGGDCQPTAPRGFAVEHVSPRLDAWETFWALYPRKKGKQAARKAWDRAVKGTDPLDIIAGARAFADHWAGQPKHRQTFIPYPERWLNTGAWDDVLDPEVDHANGSKVQATRENLVAAAREMETGLTFEQRMAQAQQIEVGTGQ